MTTAMRTVIGWSTPIVDLVHFRHVPRSQLVIQPSTGFGSMHLHLALGSGLPAYGMSRGK
jgi:hypothetical protein